MERISIFWFRRDLRLDDNAGLFRALCSTEKVLPIFIFDKNILNRIENHSNRQVAFIHSKIKELQAELEKLNTSLLVSHSTPLEFFQDITEKYQIKSVYLNEDYEQSALERDRVIGDYLKTKNIILYSYKDHVIFSKYDIVKDDNTPYTVFTPYSKKWKQKLSEKVLESYDCKPFYYNFYPFNHTEIPSLKELGFEDCTTIFPSEKINLDTIKSYSENRDYPSLDATTHLGVHLRFGTISIRKLARVAFDLNQIFLNELIWREFYHSITFHFPHVCKSYSFKKTYDKIIWRNNEEEFEAWCNGKTGYPMVDAGIRQLNETGFMHNRVRMITASFLVKHLLIDWRWGEQYFQNKLLDFDFAANNGGWQWAASCGCDAVPYFRIFNPSTQAERFDKNYIYIRKWVPEFGTDKYPKPIVDHDFARQRAITLFKKTLTESRI